MLVLLYIMPKKDKGALWVQAVNCSWYECMCEVSSLWHSLVAPVKAGELLPGQLPSPSTLEAKGGYKFGKRAPHEYFTAGSGSFQLLYFDNNSHDLWNASTLSAKEKLA